jgi:uncharacterized protein (DUF952 family)
MDVAKADLPTTCRMGSCRHSQPVVHAADYFSVAVDFLKLPVVVPTELGILFAFERCRQRLAFPGIFGKLPIERRFW